MGNNFNEDSYNKAPKTPPVRVIAGVSYSSDSFLNLFLLRKQKYLTKTVFFCVSDIQILSSIPDEYKECFAGFFQTGQSLKLKLIKLGHKLDIFDISELFYDFVLNRLINLKAQGDFIDAKSLKIQLLHKCFHLYTESLDNSYVKFSLGLCARIEDFDESIKLCANNELLHDQSDYLGHLSQKDLSFYLLTLGSLSIKERNDLKTSYMIEKVEYDKDLSEYNEKKSLLPKDLDLEYVLEAFDDEGLCFSDQVHLTSLQKKISKDDQVYWLESVNHDLKQLTYIQNGTHYRCYEISFTNNQSNCVVGSEIMYAKLEGDFVKCMLIYRSQMNALIIFEKGIHIFLGDELCLYAHPHKSAQFETCVQVISKYKKVLDEDNTLMFSSPY